jgi:uncharacterized protein
MGCPLFVKYRTPTGASYVFDSHTGHILKASSAVYDIVDDWGTCDENALRTRHAKYDKTQMAESIAEIEKVLRLGCLPDHCATVAGPCDVVIFEKTVMSPEQWLDGYRSELIVEVTQQCNMRCEYCVYGEHYSHKRSHGQSRMPVETAERAIEELIEHSFPPKGTIALWGGEPLLAFDVMKHSITYSKRVAAAHGKEIQWIVTTNGTLLTDDKVDFLCAHDVAIYISLDGPKEVHDRYRRYANGSGTYDDVIKNARRFADRYPDYSRRGFIMTFAPPYKVKECAQFFDECADWFPLMAVNGMNAASSDSGKTAYDPPADCGGSLGAPCWEDNPVCQSPQDEDIFRRLRKEYCESVAREGFEETVRRTDMKMGHFLFGIGLVSVHNRQIPEGDLLAAPRGACVPGQTRLLCTVEGDYYPCERCPLVPAFKLGSAEDGLDYGKLRRLLNLPGEMMDCGNCAGRLLCGLCYGQWPVEDGVVKWDKLATLCESFRKRIKRNLKAYTEICEKNPDAMDALPEATILNVPIPMLASFIRNAATHTQ